MKGSFIKQEAPPFAFYSQLSAIHPAQPATPQSLVSGGKAALHLCIINEIKNEVSHPKSNNKMKTLALILATVLVSSFSSVKSFAGQGDGKKSCQTISSLSEAVPSTASYQTNIFQNSAGRVTVVMLKNDEETVKLSITDANDNELFRSRIKQDSVHQNFQMNHLEPGEYRFTLNKNGECFTKTVTVK